MKPTASTAAAWAAASFLLLSSQPTYAQVLVYDPAAITQLIAQAKTAISQLEQLRAQVTQAEHLYDSFNKASDANTLAQQLLTPELRKIVPELDKLEAAAHGDLGALGELAGRAQAIREAYRAYTPADPSNDPSRLEASAARAARDLALGEKVASIGGQRLEGLDQLRAALDGASSARAVMDIEARIAAEQAMIQNDQMRLQGVAMMQAAEERLECQRLREEAATAREARMARARRGFEKQ